MSRRQQTALVTGAASGIGRACALALARAGNDLVLNDRPGNSELVSTQRAVDVLGRACRLIEADVFRADERERLVGSALATAPIDVLVSNPALNVRGPVLGLDLAQFDRVVACTLTSGFHIAQLVARSMVERSRGKIIFISSVVAEMPFAHNAAYSAAKAGLNQMARTMAVEFAQHRINVNTVEPGWIDTPGERTMFAPDILHEEGKRLPWGRMGTPDDVAHLVAFLASDAADYITGATIPVDGGFRFKDLRART